MDKALLGILIALLLLAGIILTGDLSSGRTIETSGTPAPTPTVTPTPTVGPDTLTSLSDSFNVRYFCFSSRGSMQKALRYAHENGIYADGFLMFDTLSHYVKTDRNIPCAVASGTVSYDVSLGEQCESAVHHVSIYRAEGEELERIDDAEMTQTDTGGTVNTDGLPDGMYLLCVDISITGSFGRYYSGSCFVWLRVGNTAGYGFDGFAPTPTPTHTYVPTPAAGAH